MQEASKPDSVLVGHLSNTQLDALVPQMRDCRASSNGDFVDFRGWDCPFHFPPYLAT